MIGFGVVQKAVAPYLLWIVLGAIVAAGAFGAYQGHRFGVASQKAADGKVIDDLKAQHAKDQVDLHNAAIELQAAAKSLKDINDEAARRIQEVTEANARADAAGKVASGLEARLVSLLSSRGRALETARKTGTDRCKALLATDVSELRECLP